MARIEDYLEQIIHAIYGKDVRQAIHDAILECYEYNQGEVIDALYQNSLTLESDSATTIPNDADLNDYVTVGNYKVTTIASAETISNMPYETSGRLFVMKTTQAGKIAQFYLANSSRDVFLYYRFYDGSDWSEWFAFLNKSRDLYPIVAYTTERDVSPYSDNIVTFSFDNGSINFQVNRVIANYKDADGSMKFKMFATSGEYTVPHDSFAIFNIGDGIIEVKSYAELRDTTNENYITMFYNSNGNILGSWSKYWTEQKLRQMESSNDDVPSYYESHLLTKGQEINSALLDLNGDAMVFISDHHYPSNRMHSPSIVKRICNTTGINKVFLGGDFINRETQKNNVPLNINRVGSLYEYPYVNTFRVVGNHEPNNPGASTAEEFVINQLSPSELRFSILNTFVNKVVCDENSLSYYYDDEYRKMRYIVGAVNYKSQLEQSSIKWVASKLLETPQDYSVVVIFHTILKTSGNSFVPVNTATNLINVLDAAKNSTSVSFDGETYNFTNMNVDLICAICGDMHIDGHYTTAGGVHVIATTTDSLQEEGGLTRNIGTITEQAFDVIIFNRTARKIKLIRIGAGQDREFTY